MSLWLSGIGVSRGIAIGRVHRIHATDLDIPEYEIAADALDAEVQRFEEGLTRTREQLETIRDQIPANAPPEIAAFIETHLLMLEDSALSDTVAKLIREHHCNAEWALKLQQDHLVAVFDQMDDAYLRTRRDDVVHVTARLQRVLLKEERHIEARREANREPPVIVADDLTPADIIILHQQGVGAFISEHGGPLSHSAILARSLRIPAIVGMHAARRLLLDDETVVVDGEAGHVLAAPDAEAIEFYRHRQKRDQRYRRMLGKLKGEPAITADGVPIRLLANVELPDDSADAAEVGADGIGLYRTEFLYMNREDMPSEEEQLAAYRRVLRSVDGPVTIRTLDLGADKTLGQGRDPAQSTNPALGLRAIRLCLKETDMFRVQLRALLRASAEGDVRVMLPMISNTQELKQTRHLIGETMNQLRAEGHAFNSALPVGAMIEVPAAALSAPLLARHADFFSLGTNDLIQYTLAMDRVDDEINYLYDPLHPAVLRLIKLTIEAGEQAPIPVSMCGEMASDRRYTRLLLGLGLTEFSMHPASILEVKQLIMQSNVAALREQVDAMLACGDADEFREHLDALDEPAPA
ncbi:phosphoenolpyruvate--protein phosphotransferase [Spectribacter hydrogenoxidans]|uniref:Phosphoenolpyruvate-protein phosphotransferase n=1 Tax=Spectribacter hydrogenoxidans TaxID=3075608 RepID=A0ABU3BX15_9GAMM|nr:phosphoenolpyruvate--protein phosphotransferase [Salinisphaera sp. W335]MDT0633836.1 phosphoenolpyruvate--protein phosphotransferase [Salinisphaera sp. W335]